MAVTIRTSRDEDVAAILALASRLTLGVAPWRERSAVVTAVRGWVADAVASSNDPTHALFVARDGERIVGFISASRTEHWAGDIDAGIGELVVDGAAEGRGIGSALVERTLDWSRAQGIGRVSVSTGAANARALGLYRKLGFEDEDVTLSRPA